jgi:hypothetical protein
MLNHILFFMRMTKSSYSIQHLVDVTFSYLEMIIPYMLKNDRLMLNYSLIDLLRSSVDKKEISITEIIAFAERLQQQYSFNDEQQDLFDAIKSELQRERTRKIVLQPLLKPFQELFNDTTIESQVHTLSNMIWHYLKNI